MNHSMNQTWTSLCDESWSNVGLHHYPPTDPSICYAYIPVFDAIYVAGSCLAILGICGIIQALLRTGRSGYEKTKMLRFCFIICLTYHVCILGMEYPRLYLTHEEEILGTKAMIPYAPIYQVASVAFWLAVFAFFYKYLAYIKATFSAALLAGSKKSFRVAQVGYLIGWFVCVFMAVMWGLLGFVRDESNITKRGIRCSLSTDASIIMAALVAWPLVSGSVIKDMQALVENARSSGKGTKASDVTRKVQTNLLRLKIFSCLVYFMGFEGIVSFFLTLYWPVFPYVLTYSMSFIIHIVAQVVLLIIVRILRPTGKFKISRVTHFNPNSQVLSRVGSIMSSKVSSSVGISAGRDGLASTDQY